MEGGSLKVTFNEEKVININVSDAEPTESNQFSISTACRGATGIEPIYITPIRRDLVITKNI